MTSSESEEQSSTRKRGRASNSTEDGAAAGAKKARGRPRVDTQDATAADRRRTQIRLAQRAYRQRKETIISSLKNQSTQLHAIIEQMNKTFLRLNESAQKSGLLQLNAGLAQEYKLATETFGNLTKTASESQYLGDEEHYEAAETASSDRRAQNSDPPEPKAQHIGWGYSAVAEPTTSSDSAQRKEIRIETQPDNYFNQLGGAFDHPSTSHSLIRRRQFTVGDVLDQSRSSGITPTALDQPQQLPFGLIDILSQQQAPYAPPNPDVYSVNIPTPDVTPPTTRLSTPPLQLPSISTKTLKPAKTYSFDETTFARRLTRATLETGLQLLSHANIRPAALSYVFRLSLPYLSLDQLRARFKTMLARCQYEDLDWWETPFIHLGGAGTHYPRRDASGNIKRLRNGWTVRQTGPLEKNMTRLQSLDDGTFQDLSGVDLSGFEGEWFDAYDVEGYLEEQYACKLDPKSSFAECLVAEEDDEDIADIPSLQPRTHGPDDYRPPSLAHSSSTASSASVTPPTNAYTGLSDTSPFGLDMSFDNAPTTNYASDLPKIMNYDISFDQTLGLDLAPGYDYDFNNVNDMDLGLDMMGGDNMESLPIVRQRRKKSAWVDVGRLINEIIKHGVCLGRAPGFRRRDVDMALQKALVVAY